MIVVAHNSTLRPEGVPVGLHRLTLVFSAPVDVVHIVFVGPREELEIAAETKAELMDAVSFGHPLIPIGCPPVRHERYLYTRNTVTGEVVHSKDPDHEVGTSYGAKPMYWKPERTAPATRSEAKSVPFGAAPENPQWVDDLQDLKSGDVILLALWNRTQLVRLEMYEVEGVRVVHGRAYADVRGMLETRFGGRPVTKAGWAPGLLSSGPDKEDMASVIRLATNDDVAYMTQYIRENGDYPSLEYWLSNKNSVGEAGRRFVREALSKSTKEE